jgi:hypothetical protein
MMNVGSMVNNSSFDLLRGKDSGTVLRKAYEFLGSPHVLRRMEDSFLQVQDGGGAIKGFGLALIDHGLKDGDLLWFQEVLLQCGLPA